MPYKNYLEVERETEPELYRICKELEENGKSAIKTYIDTYESVSRTFGRRAKPLIEHNPPLLFPIGRTLKCRKNSLALIQTPNNVDVIEKKGEKKSFFHFTKIKRRI